MKTAAWVLIPLLIIGAFIFVGYQFLASEGTPTATQITVPPLATQTQKDAEAKLVSLKLKPAITEEHSAEVEKGVVISSDPQAGTKVDEGATVTLKISLGVEKVKVPDGLIGMSPEDARAALEAVGLEGVVTPAVSSREQDKVFDTKPKSGDSVPEGTSVKLYVPKAQVPVPSVVGQTQEDAERTLKAENFKVKVVPQANDQPPGTVIAQSPEAGTNLNQRTTVTIVVSTGPEVQPTEEPTFTPTEEPTDIPTDDATEDPGDDTGEPPDLGP
ncbi:PASTA domain-containing protein [Nonomuraea recticatena]|uniref:PASTA domain-containing protein n=1 Tax=Nonomuraea recticatena TaxID=46178 RepID=UPI003622AD4D